MSSSASTLIHLATLISSNTAKVEDYLKGADHPYPSFEASGPATALPTDAPPEIEAARLAAVEASIELTQLLQGTTALLFPYVRIHFLISVYTNFISQR